MAPVSLSPWERGRGEGRRLPGVKTLIRPAIGVRQNALWPATFSRGEKG